jgi:hypothetical protein
MQEVVKSCTACSELYKHSALCFLQIPMQLENGWVWGPFDLVPVALCVYTLVLGLLRLPPAFPSGDDLLFFSSYPASRVVLLGPFCAFLSPFLLLLPS